MIGDRDGELLVAAKRFDKPALELIYDTYSPGLYVYSIRLLGDAQLAEDCVSETFGRFLNALQAGRGPHSHLQAYLYRIAHNWITDQYRRQPPPPVLLDENMQSGSDQVIEQEADRRILADQVRAALYRLTPDQRQVVMLKFYDGWDNGAIAAALNKPVGAVKSLQHRAIEALKRMLLLEEGIANYGPQPQNE